MVGIILEVKYAKVGIVVVWHFSVVVHLEEP